MTLQRSHICLFVTFVCLQALGASAPPDHNDIAKMARYILRSSMWVSVASISIQAGIKGYPFVALKSVSDGPEANSTGVPYLYMTDMDVTARDIAVNSKCTIMASLAQSDYCAQNEFDPQDPRCAKLIISGKLVKVDNSSAEYQFGLNALFSKHPAMRNWPKGHNFYVAKVTIDNIEVLDFFGGIKHVTIEDYFNANDISEYTRSKYDIKIELV